MTPSIYVKDKLSYIFEKVKMCAMHKSSYKFTVIGLKCILLDQLNQSKDNEIVNLIIFYCKIFFKIVFFCLK